MPEIVRIVRLLQLVELLSSGRTLNATLLADICQVSRRTIFRDLKILQASGVRILYDEERQCYSLPARQFLPPADLSLEETLALIIVGHELGHQQVGFPFGPQVRTAALKLASNLPDRLREYVQGISEAILIRLGPQEQTVHETPIFETLRQAISKHHPLRIDYESLSEEQKICTVLSPYRIVFSRRDWYVIGRSSVHRAVRTFKVARITKAVLLHTHYEIPPRFNLDRYLGNAWHLIREAGERHEICVRFKKLVAQNVAEVTWHKTQRVKWNKDGTLDFHATVDGLNEVSWWILGYGDQAEVVAPSKLRTLVAGRVRGMHKIYAAD